MTVTKFVDEKRQRTWQARAILLPTLVVGVVGIVFAASMTRLSRKRQLGGKVPLCRAVITAACSPWLSGGALSKPTTGAPNYPGVDKTMGGDELLEPMRLGSSSASHPSTSPLLRKQAPRLDFRQELRGYTGAIADKERIEPIALHHI